MIRTHDAHLLVASFVFAIGFSFLALGFVDHIVVTLRTRITQDMNGMYGRSSASGTHVMSRQMLRCDTLLDRVLYEGTGSVRTTYCTSNRFLLPMPTL